MFSIWCLGIDMKRATETVSLTDESPMWFGEHRGKPLRDVPASYLFWLWTEELSEASHKPLSKYIRENLHILEREYPDGIW